MTNYIHSPCVLPRLSSEELTYQQGFGSLVQTPRTLSSERKRTIVMSPSYKNTHCDTGVIYLVWEFHLYILWDNYDKDDDN